MALDRTWYNTLVDDDGTELTGSVWDKADVDSLMDAVDAELGRLQQNRASWALTATTAEGTTCAVAASTADYQILGDQLNWRIHVQLTVPVATLAIHVMLPATRQPVLDNVDESLVRLYLTAGEVGYAVVRTWPYLKVQRLTGATFPTGVAYIIGSGFYFIR
jgi:hypothetical protein